MGGAVRQGGGVEARAAPSRAVCMAGGYLLPSRSPERGKGDSESTAQIKAAAPARVLTGATALGAKPRDAA